MNALVWLVYIGRCVHCTETCIRFGIIVSMIYSMDWISVRACGGNGELTRSRLLVICSIYVISMLHDFSRMHVQNVRTPNIPILRSCWCSLFRSPELGMRIHCTISHGKYTGYYNSYWFNAFVMHSQWRLHLGYSEHFGHFASAHYYRGGFCFPVIICQNSNSN